MTAQSSRNPTPGAGHRIGSRRLAPMRLVAGAWSTVMPPVGDAIGDEIDQIDGAQSLSSTLGPGVKGLLRDAELQNVKSQKSITTFWPPVVGDD